MPPKKRNNKKNKKHKPSPPIQTPKINIPEEIQKALQFHRAGNTKDAKPIYEQILRVDPDYSDALNLLGAALYQEGIYKEAEDLILKAIDIQPRNISYYNNLGAVYQAVEKKQEAIDCFQKALEIDPGFLDAKYNLSAVLLNMGESEKAMGYLRETLEVNPENPETHFNMAVIFKEKRNYEEAEKYFLRAIQLNSRHVEAHYKLGVTYRDQGKVDEAISMYQQTLELKPDHDIAFSRMIHLMQYRCDWKDLARLTPELDRITAETDYEAVQTAETPFENITRHADPELNYRIARSWSLDMQRRVSHLALTHVPPSSKKEHVTIGYLSNDFRDHPVGHLIQRLFELHDNDRFRIHAYSFGKNDESVCRKKIENNCDQFVDIMNMSNPDAAARIKADGVDILVDLMGYTGGSRLELLAYRPAPIQATYLGFPGTTGADFVDYIVTDKIVTPDDAAPHYSEKLIRMPHCYLVTNNVQPVSNHGWKKANFSLPEKSFVYCSFNAFYKIEPVMFETWMRILKRVPGSILWLSNTLKKNKANFKAFMEDMGVDPARVVYAKRLPDKSEHLERLGKADLILDTRIYNGHASCCDALWAGVPVVALTGSHFASRVSTSALLAMNMPELAVDGLEAYEELAVQLAIDREKYIALRTRLIQNRHTAPLFNNLAFTRTLEKGFMQMWENYCSGNKPQPVDLEPDTAFTAVSGGGMLAKLDKAAKLHRSGDLNAAETLYREILQVQPNHKDALHLLGVIAHQKGDQNRALDLIQRAIALDSNVHWYYGNLGLALQAVGRFDDAINAYNRALSMKPDFFECHNNLGTAFKDIKEFNKAEACYLKSIEIKPGYAVAHYNLGVLYQQQNKPSKAVQFLESALQLNPEYADACNLLVHQLQQVCAWSKIPVYKSKRDAFTRRSLQEGKRPAEKPFENIIICDDPALNYAVAKAWAADSEAVAAKMDVQFSHTSIVKRSSGVIRIGYLSKDFRNHAVGHLIRSLFKTHDRSRFCVNCYSYGENDNSDYRKGIEQDCDVFADIRELKDKQAAERIYNDGVDILVNLMGYTGGENRLPICAARPAPVQVSWLGFPGTTGANFFDYIITDRIVTPESHLPYYSEKPVFMPHAYQINDNRQKIADVAFTRESLGLPPEGVVFCSFSQHYKIEPVMFNTWMNILKRVQNSVLWLILGYEESRRRLREAAQSMGVDSQRLIFAGHISKAEHLARHQIADIALDTRIVNGHTTTSDALWAGVPVITLIGGHFASRVSASLLSAALLPELVVNTIEDYENLAVSLAEDTVRLESVRRKLDESKLSCPLFDTERFVRGLETAYNRMWEVHTKGGVHQRINLVDRLSVDVNAELAKGVESHQAGRLEEAGVHYQRVLNLRPDHPDALHLSGVLAYQMQRSDRAEPLIRRAIEIQPNTPGYYSNLGLVLAGQDKLEEAVDAYRKALSLNPNLPDAYSNLGNLLKKEGRREEALDCYRKALDIKPDYPEACFNMANVLKTMGRMDEAVSFYEKAAALKPDYVQAYNGMGVTFKEMGDLERASQCYQKAIEIAPDLPDAYNNLGNVLIEMGESDKGVACYQRALRLKPDNYGTLNNLGNEYKNKGRHENALYCFQKALAIKPDYSEAAANLYTQKRLLCFWDNIDASGRKLDQFTKDALAKKVRPSESPFINIMRYMDPEKNLWVAEAWSRDLKNRAAWRRFQPESEHNDVKKRKIRIGYLSNDFRNHPVGHIIQALFSLHDRDEFEIFCFSYGPDDGSEYRQKIMNDCDCFVDVRRMAHFDAAALIREHKTDILIDLMGYTTGSRIAVSAHRPAPIQVNWLGYPGTTGADFFDYIIGDKVVIPDSHIPFFSEKPVFMPHSYLIFNNLQPVSPKRYQRTLFNVPEDAFVFASFNSVYKIEPLLFDAWMRILNRTPGSVLWLSHPHHAVRRNLMKAASYREIDPNRLIFSQRIAEKSEHLSRLKLADLILDTWCYNGHVSTADALWAETPVLTRKGGHFASRVAAGVLHAAGIPELVVETAAAYEDEAVRIAQDSMALTRIKTKIEKSKLESPFFDTGEFVRYLERAYRRMHQLRIDGKNPDIIDLSKTN